MHEAGQANRGNSDRPDRPEVAGRVEWCQERYPEPAVGEPVQDAMRSRAECQEGPRRPRTHWADTAWIPKPDHHPGQSHGEGKAMGQPPVTQQVSVLDAEPKADDVEIGNDGEHRTDEGEAPWDSGPIETCPDGKGSYGVRRRGRHERVV